MPLTVGVPLMVNTPASKVPVTPVGSPVAPAPVAVPPTAYVILVIAVLIQRVWEVVPAADVNEIVPLPFTVIDPLNDALIQGPVVVTV